VAVPRKLTLPLSCNWVSSAVHVKPWLSCCRLRPAHCFQQTAQTFWIERLHTSPILHHLCALGSRLQMKTGSTVVSGVDFCLLVAVFAAHIYAIPACSTKGKSLQRPCSITITCSILQRARASRSCAAAGCIPCHMLMSHQT